MYIRVYLKLSTTESIHVSSSSCMIFKSLDCTHSFYLSHLTASFAFCPPSRATFPNVYGGFVTHTIAPNTCYYTYICLNIYYVIYMFHFVKSTRCANMWICGKKVFLKNTYTKYITTTIKICITSTRDSFECIKWSVFLPRPLAESFLFWFFFSVENASFSLNNLWKCTGTFLTHTHTHIHTYEMESCSKSRYESK